MAEDIAQPAGGTRRRTARLHFRVDADQDARIRQAAALAHETVTDFVVRSAVGRADRVLDEHRRLTMSPDAFDAFVAALDAPPRPVPELAELFSRPSRIPQTPPVRPEAVPPTGHASGAGA